MKYPFHRPHWSVIPFFLFLVNLSPLFGLSFFENTPTPVSEGKVLVLAIAPFETKDGKGGEGRELQKNIADEFRQVNSMKVIELSRPVSLGPDHTLEEGFADAENILAQSKADLLIWGDQNEMALGGKWNIYFSVSNHVQSAVRSEGFSMHRVGYLRGVTESDTSEIVRWIVEGWAGLIEKSKGMDLSGQLQGLDVKIYSLLGDAQQKRWNPGTLRELKRSLSIPLCSYANSTHDIPTLRRAVALVHEIAESYPDSEHFAARAEDQGNLACMLEGLGEAESSPKDLQESVKACRNALQFIKPRSDPFGYSSTQLNLGNALVRLGQRENGDHTLREAITAFQEGLKGSTRLSDPARWAYLQNGLATAYVSLGEKKPDLETFQLALDHYLAALKEAKVTFAPMDVAMLQLNTSTAYFRLGEMRHSQTDDLKAIDLCQQAVTAYRQANYSYALAVALSDLGCTQMSLGHFKNDDKATLNQSLATMGESMAILPKEQNPILWAQNRQNMGIVSRFLGTRTRDRALFLEAIQACEDIQSVNTKETMPEQWAQLDGLKGAYYGYLAEAYRDPLYLEKGEENINESLRMLGAETSSDDWIHSNYESGLLGLLKGWQDKDAGLLLGAIGKIETSLSLLKADSPDQCDFRSDLCEAYSYYLSLKEDPAARGKAKELLDYFMKNCETPKEADSQGEHWMNTARLEVVLAKSSKDLSQMNEARTYAVKAIKVLEENGYVFNKAKAEIILGDIDSALGDSSKAVGEYSSARKTLKSYALFWKTTLDGKLQEAKANPEK